MRVAHEKRFLVVCCSSSKSFWLSRSVIFSTGVRNENQHGDEPFVCFFRPSSFFFVLKRVMSLPQWSRLWIWINDKGRISPGPILVNRIAGQAASHSPLWWQFGTLLLCRQILASGQAFWLIPFCHVDIQQSTIDSNSLEKSGVDIGGMVVGYFRFGRVAPHC
jgi:hypothetical protein